MEINREIVIICLLAVSLIPVVVMFIGIKYQQWQGNSPSKPNKVWTEQIPEKTDSHGFIELSGNDAVFVGGHIFGTR